MGEVKEFPKSAGERAALRKAKADAERQRLINAFVVEDGNGLFVSADDIAYADIHVNGCRQTWPVRSTQFRMAYVRYLKRQMDQPSTSDPLVTTLLRPHLSKRRVNEAVEEFELQAQGSGLVRDVHLRVAEDCGDLYIDLCDPDWQAIPVTAVGWQVVQSPPVRFRRTPGMLPLPFPERGATIDALHPFLNIPPGDIHIVVAWLLAALRDRGPYPILVLTGEHGSAKSTFGRILRSLIDPNRVALATLPPSGRDLFIAAHNSRALMFENVSRLSPVLSDNLCRLATGAGFRIRKLHTNADETLLTAQRPILLEGISNFVTRGDLQDRSITLALEPVTNRRTEAELMREFEIARPRIFGALLDMLVAGIRDLPNAKLLDTPRMADFAHWAVACGVVSFEGAYKANREEAIAILLEHDPLAQALLRFVQSPWSGTATELLKALGSGIAKNPKVLSDDLRRIAPMLRAAGLFDVAYDRTNKRRAIKIVRLGRKKQ
jgi:hypothetical protein